LDSIPFLSQLWVKIGQITMPGFLVMEFIPHTR